MHRLFSHHNNTDMVIKNTCSSNILTDQWLLSVEYDSEHPVTLQEHNNGSVTPWLLKDRVKDLFKDTKIYKEKDS